MKKILRILGKFFTDLYTSFMKDGKAVYDSLPEDQKIALSHGSGLVAVLNDTIGKTPAEIRSDIMKKFPNIDVVKLEQVILGLCQKYSLTNFANLDEATLLLQKYLTSQQGNDWELLSHFMACAASIIFGPPNMKVPAVVSLMEIVYTYVIQPLFLKK